MLACDCLNVIIDTAEDDFHLVTSDFLNLNEEELKDPFFKQDLQQVGKLININKSHAGLILTRNVGSWIIHYCINCDVHSHAVHRDRGASCVLVNSKLLRSQEIQKLQSTDSFSKIYKIIIKNTEVDNDENIASSPYLPSEAQNIIKGLKQIASDALKNEALAVEKRVKAFATEQYNLLNDLREKAFREQQALISTIISTMADRSNKNINTNDSFTSNTLPSRLNEPLDAGGNTAPIPISSSKHTPKRQKSCPAAPVNSYDSEPFFDFEGIDDVLTPDASEEESDGNEGTKDEVAKTTSRDNRSSINAMAKSLPMDIPTFMAQGRSREDLDDTDPLDDNLDIAASIKALAKSVHGDPIFGDLPKPRYSTYI